MNLIQRLLNNFPEKVLSNFSSERLNHIAGDLSSVTFLINNGAGVKARDNDGKSAQEIAEENGNQKC